MANATLTHYKTKNDLNQSLRDKMNVLLNQSLADAIDLQLQCKQAHWNVKGPDFIALHKLFDEITEDAEEYVDLLAERIVQLGGVADGTVQAAAKHTRLAAYPTNIGDGHAHVDALSNALATFGKHVRHGIDQADEAKDKDTADIYTEISRGVDKWLWFVEAHLQTEH